MQAGPRVQRDAPVGSAFHLTARPWTPVDLPREALLDRVEDIITQLATVQYYNDANPNDVQNGAIIDPYNNAEVQYATPYFAFAVASAVSEGRSPQLLTAGIRAMDHAIADISGLDGSAQANDNHGEFFVAPMMKALRLFKQMEATGDYPELTPLLIATWEFRLHTPRTRFMNMGVTQNWRTYAMKGEWLRYQDGLIASSVGWIEDNWLQPSEGYQRARFRRGEDVYGIDPPIYMYHDDTGFPETFAYHAGAAGNLFDMLENGYDGPSAGEMRRILEPSIANSLLLMGGSGEAPAGGRTGDHVWNDIVYANNFEMLAQAKRRRGENRIAGQLHRASNLALESAFRFQQERGWFSVTKNLFHPSLKNHYASYSALTNYNGYTEIHLAEDYFARSTRITEQPTPAEIGGYVHTLDPEYASVFVSAGGMQLQICTRGSNQPYAGVPWHTFGIDRFSRPGWDSRLGPADGEAFADFSDAVSFAPAFQENGAWIPVCRQPARFGGTFTPDFVHPLLVRGTLDIAPLSGQTGPSFRMDLVVTPDGVLVDTTRTQGANPFAITWPLLTYDGRTELIAGVAGDIASTTYPMLDAPMLTNPAEDASLFGDTAIESNYANYHGSGFANLPPDGGAVEWTAVDGGAGGPSTLGFRYALGISSGSTRTASLTINGEARAITFDSTGAWSDWHQIDIPADLLPGGANTVRLESIGEDCANIDELRVRAPGAAMGRPVPDRQHFIAVGAPVTIDGGLPVVRGPQGDLLPVRVSPASGDTVTTFVYPWSEGDPAGGSVRDGFARTPDGFSTPLGRVTGDLYVGRWAAGGRSSAIDLDADGQPDVTLSRECNFILRHANGAVTTIEADTATIATISPAFTAGHGEVRLWLRPFSPAGLPGG